MPRIQFKIPFSFYRIETGVLAFDIEDHFHSGPEDEPVAICGCKVSIITKNMTLNNAAWLSHGGTAAFVTGCERACLRKHLSKRRQVFRLLPLENSFEVRLEKTPLDWRLGFRFVDGLCESNGMGEPVSPRAHREAHRLQANLEGLWVAKEHVIGMIPFLRKPLEAPMERE